MAIITLDPIDPAAVVDGLDGVNHPMRHITETIINDGSWGADRRADVASFFDELAKDWSGSRSAEQRASALDDVFVRAADWVPRATGFALELGVGSGMFTPTLVKRWGTVVAADISPAMLAEVPPGLAPVMRADASRLPLVDRSTHLIVLANMFLFPAEMDRVLADGGAIVWLNSRGVNTPIHLTTEAVLDALPGEWSAVESQFGAATWAVCRRSSQVPPGKIGVVASTTA